MRNRKSFNFEKRLILSAIAADALRHLAHTLNEAGWTNIELSSLGLTAESSRSGQHLIVVTCLPCNQADTELMITISSQMKSECDYSSLDIDGMFDALRKVTNTSKPLN